MEIKEFFNGQKAHFSGNSEGAAFPYISGGCSVA
jgi:hypothetical protein